MLALIAAAALASAPNSTPYNDGMPPAVFRGDAVVTMEFADRPKLERICHELFGTPPAGMRTKACATGRRLILPNPCDFPDDEYARLVCHELGHANGWPSTHGDFETLPVKQEEPVVSAASDREDDAPIR